MRRRLATLLVASSLLLAGGCGEQDEPAAAPSAPAVVVAMRGLEFVPREVSVRAGQTVRWVNESDIQHNAVAESGAEFRSPLFGRDGTYEARLEKPGTVRYVCTIHPGMDGTLRVSG